MLGFIIAAQAAGRKGHRTRHTFILRGAKPMYRRQYRHSTVVLMDVLL